MHRLKMACVGVLLLLLLSPLPAAERVALDMYGNVIEWVADCWNGSYVGAPDTGRAWTDGNCPRRVLRGGSLVSTPAGLRSADRFSARRSYRGHDAGFRLAMTL